MLQELGGIVCGIGPGPFTGLRVGIVSAQSIGYALNIPVFGICSHDAIAFEYAQKNPNQDVTVITDARRKEVYWTRYQGIKRITTPIVSKIEEVSNKGVKLLHQPLCPVSLANVAIEAMACGVPVVSYRRGGPSEVILHGETGYLVEPDDIGGMVAALEGVPALSRQKCRAHVEKEFSTNALRSAAKYG